MSNELAAAKSQFQTERDAWNTEQDANQQRLSQERGKWQQEREQLLNEFATRTADADGDGDGEQAEQGSQLNQLHGDLEAVRTEFQTEQVAWQQERDKLLSEVASLRSDSESAAGAQSAECDTQFGEIQAERAQFHAEREAWIEEARQLENQQIESVKQVQSDYEQQFADEPEALAAEHSELLDRLKRAEAVDSDGVADDGPAEQPMASPPAESSVDDYQEPEELELEAVSESAPASASDILAQLGESPQWEDEPEASDDLSPDLASKVNLAAAPPPPASNDQAGDDESIEDYMSQLMQRVTGSEGSFEMSGSAPKSPAPASKPASPSSVASPEEPTDEPPTSTDDAELGEYMPRSAAPENWVNMEAMRELANMSARSAIRTHQKRQRGAAFAWKMLAGGFALFTGVIAILVGDWGSLWSISAVTLSFALAIYIFAENLVSSFAVNTLRAQKRTQVATSTPAVATEDDLTDSADQG